ncbi:DUF1109 domain-containing protein [Neorhodopirellula pilleata]|uniref:VanZ like family protein n=1 Tax=Neorhodopirellula pilleata TaxID=2714738 RepID=A0A5C6ATB6_9BACT|nr:DUF1109 domain-containing protein [Neorhodopirellula pilleata]TWU03245.1 hypothetical protein Pla100_01630 [Neorhodopirellula pilleata]
MTSSIDDPEQNEDTPDDISSVEPGQPIAWLALVGFVLAAAVLLIPIPLQGRVAEAVGDLAHAPLFGGFTVSILLLWHRVRPLHHFGRDWLGRIALVALCVFIAGILVELTQSLTGRKAAFHDVVANGIGILAAASLCIGLLNHLHRPEHRPLTIAMIVLTVVLGVASTVAPLRILRDVWEVHRAYPVINSFESPNDVKRWYLDDCSVQRVQSNVTEGEYAMRWLIQDAEHPAITLIETASDWSDAASLELDVTLDPSYPEDVSVFVKVIDYEHTDYHHDVCRKEFRIEPGRTQHLTVSRQEMIEGPDSRKLDLTRIKFVSLVCYRPGKDTWIDVDAIRVELRR